MSNIIVLVYYNQVHRDVPKLTAIFFFKDTKSGQSGRILNTRFPCRRGDILKLHPSSEIRDLISSYARL